MKSKQFLGLQVRWDDNWQMTIRSHSHIHSRQPEISYKNKSLYNSKCRGGFILCLGSVKNEVADWLLGAWRLATCRCRYSRTRRRQGSRRRRNRRGVQWDGCLPLQPTTISGKCHGPLYSLVCGGKRIYRSTIIVWSLCNSTSFFLLNYYLQKIHKLNRLILFHKFLQLFLNVIKFSR